MTRRDRLERIATAERDRRAGRIEVAVAAIGEPVEWPARVVLALARLSDDEGDAARQVLEEGLDHWARDVGLESLDAVAALSEASLDAEPVSPLVPPAAVESELDQPLEPAELDLAFAEAEAQVDEMHDVNTVAARVLMDEPVGLAELDGNLLDASDADQDASPAEDAFGVDAASVEPLPSFDPVGSTEPRPDEVPTSQPIDHRSEPQALATLERWLQNLERRMGGRAR